MEIVRDLAIFFVLLLPLILWLLIARSRQTAWLDELHRLELEHEAEKRKHPKIEKDELDE